MELSEVQERLKKLDTSKLTDVVKNYKQYGYSEEIRNYAISLLAEQGISKEDLQLTGSYENASYNSADSLYKSFKKNSMIAFISFALLLMIKIIPRYLDIQSTEFVLTITIITILLFASYFIFLIKSFLNQSEFYKLANDDFGSQGALTYFFLGMPFYVVMYFVFQNQMKEQMKSIL